MSENTPKPPDDASQGAAPHPSRSAPLCKNCKHVHLPRGLMDLAQCNHPIQPASLVDSSPLAECRLARMDDERVTARGTVVLCGSEGSLFSAAQG